MERPPGATAPKGPGSRGTLAPASGPCAHADSVSMFARYFVELPTHHERVEAVLTDTPRAWLPGIATEANLHGDRLLAEVGIGEKVRIARDVTIDLGAPMRLSTKTIIPLRWTATGVSGLFPSLDADLEIAPLGHDRCQLSMSARYVPPLGSVGRAIDRAVLFRVAEGTIKNFLDQVRDSIIREVGLENEASRSSIL